MTIIKWVLYHVDETQYDNTIILGELTKFTYWSGREVEQFATREELMAHIPDGIWQDHPEFSPLGVATICSQGGLVWIVFPVDKPPE